jgi:signal transduction histidine kinase
VVVSVRGVEVETGDDGMGLVLMAPTSAALEVAVTDAGPGIPESERERIFDAFYQIDGSSTREHGGTGLGLSIVKRLVEAHGGQVWVESAPVRGATFRFTLPLVTGD